MYECINCFVTLEGSLGDKEDLPCRVEMIPVRSSQSVSLFPGGIKQEGHLNANLGLTDAKTYILSSFKNALQSGRIAPATF